MRSKTNAVIMAAGMSTRLVPLSLEHPKALLRVNGERLIERQIRQLREAGIDEIIVVTGYMNEQMSYLEKQFDVSCIYNPDYETRNNHSSLYAVRNYIHDTFICSGDNYFTENVFFNTSEHSYYAAEYADGKTDEWCLKTDHDGRITDITIGGENSLFMKGHAYLKKEFSHMLIPLIEKAYHDPKAADLFWEDIFLQHIQELPLYAKQYQTGVIYEFDSLEELRRFDSSYLFASNSSWIERICRDYNVKPHEITNFRPVKEANKAVGFSCSIGQNTYKFLTKE